MKKGQRISEIIDYVPMNEEEAIELAKVIEVLDGFSSKAKDNMKKYLNNLPHNTKVSGNKTTFELDRVVSWEFKAEKMQDFMDKLSEVGENPYSYLSVTASNLKKVAWLSESELNVYAYRKENTRFKAKALPKK